jgi:salicylate hydroxylase
VRDALFGPQKAQFTGCMAWRGLVSAEQLPEGSVQSMGTNWIGPGAHVVTYPLRGGQLVNFVGIVERSDWKVESWTEPGSIDECLRDFAGWHDDVHTLIRNVKQPFKWALVGRESLASWTRERVTLMGDAAHPTLPFLAQGACMAIEDAIVLARCIDAHGTNTAAALHRYEAMRIDRTTRVVRGSAENTKRFHNPALISVEGAQKYVDQEWTEDKVRSRYNWLFEYDALAQPITRAVAHS